jgi:hypothetical protein
MKYVFFILLAVILVSSLSISSCRRAYLAGQESAAQLGAPNTQQPAPNTPAGSPAPSNPQSAGFPVIDRFAAYPITTSWGDAGGYAMTWSVSNATSVTLSPGIGAVAPSENRTISPNTTTTYILTATNPTGSRSKAITLTVP